MVNKRLIDQCVADIGYVESEPSDSEVLHVHMYTAFAAAVLVLLIWLV